MFVVLVLKGAICLVKVRSRLCLESDVAVDFLVDRIAVLFQLERSQRVLDGFTDA